MLINMVHFMFSIFFSGGLNATVQLMYVVVQWFPTTVPRSSGVPWEGLPVERGME